MSVIEAYRKKTKAEQRVRVFTLASVVQHLYSVHTPICKIML